MSINWEQVARDNGLSPEEFTKEILHIACVLGVMQIDKREVGTVLTFTPEDSISKVELTIRRVEDE